MNWAIWLERPRSRFPPTGSRRLPLSAREIKLIANWPVLDRLEKIGFCGPLTEQAEGLVKEPVESRVYVAFRP